MSEHQYYAFQAVDRPLDGAAQAALRAISSRARITATGFTNHYEWGDLKADPRALVARWFDLHLHLTNWGTRRLMIRLPRRCLDRAALAPFLGGVDGVEIATAGDHAIVDIARDDVWIDEDADDDAGWLPALAPLRADLRAGDLRLFYLLWLAAVQDGRVAGDAAEPLPGLAPLTAALQAFAGFFGIDADLVVAAAERAAEAAVREDDRRAMLAALPEAEKVALLLRVTAGDPDVGAELRRRLRPAPGPSTPRRTAAALRERARAIAAARERARAARREAERRRQAKAAETARRARIDALKRRGESVWAGIEAEIERRNPAGYDRAMGLLADLRALAAEEGRADDFARRLVALRRRHERKVRFIERLDRLGQGDEGS